jgi:hypothetical protein
MSLAVQVNNVRLIPNAQAGRLSCSFGEVVWNQQKIVSVHSIESVFIDKGSLTLLLTVKNEGFKLFQVQSSDQLAALQDWFCAQPQLKLERNSTAYASLVNPHLRSAKEATLDVFEAFAQIPKRFNDFFMKREQQRPRRQQKTLPTNPWIKERPLELTVSQITPGKSVEIALEAVDFEKCSLLVYNSGGSALNAPGWYWKGWTEAKSGKDETMPAASESPKLASDVIDRIEKDLPRLGLDDAALTDRTRGLLFLAAQRFPEIGYVQGMADLALPFARLLSEEEAASKAFLIFFNEFKDNFSLDSSSMTGQLEDLYANIQELSPLLADWLSFNRDCRALLFAYRWLLVLLRREFKTAEVDRLWSVMMAAEIVKKVSLHSYLLAFCTAMVLSCKQELKEECSRFEDVIKVNDCENRII